MRKCVSRPRVIPKRPKRLGNSANVWLSRLTPSSSGNGEGQARTSSTQVLLMPTTPMVGITAIGLPTAGKIKNQGRVGLCQNWVKYPEK